MVDKNRDNKLDSEIEKRLDDLFGEGDSSFGKSRALKADDVIVDEDNSPDPEPADPEPADPEPADEDEEIFDLEDAVAAEMQAGNTSADYPLAELKNMVLSIDWEITDEVLAGFLSQIGDLKKIYKNEKIILMFLQLLDSLGVYIKTNRGKAHPKTFKILNSVFSRLEEVVLTDDMADSEKRKLLKAEMNKYKQLRKQVAQKKAAQVSQQKAKPVKKDRLQLHIPKKKKSTRPPDRVPAAAKKEKPVIDSAADISSETMAEAIEELKQFIHSEINALRQELKILKKWS